MELDLVRQTWGTHVTEECVATPGSDLTQTSQISSLSLPLSLPPCSQSWPITHHPHASASKSRGYRSEPWCPTFRPRLLLCCHPPSSLLTVCSRTHVCSLNLLSCTLQSPLPWIVPQFRCFSVKGFLSQWHHHILQLCSSYFYLLYQG